VSGTAVQFTLNGKAVSSAMPTTSPLLYVLRDEFDINGAKFGCGLGECGACTVLVGNTATRSCQMPLAEASGKQVTTLEGLGTEEHPSVVQAAFIQEQAAQCGYCINGMIMQATGLLRQNAHPTRPEIIAWMDNNMCRCGTHLRILRAIENAAVKGGA
jgi:nicotinate dehydrogenase subunit A